MRNKLCILVMFVFSLFACGDKHAKIKPIQEIPKALDEKSPAYELVSKRGYDDLVETLYNELVSKDMDLKALEDKIDALNASERDSTNTFYRFNEKNQTYFKDVDKHISEINDTLIREKMKNLLTSHITQYKNSIVTHNEFINLIKDKNLTISDIHIVLKIVKTLPLIERYQQENLPNTKSLQGLIKQQDAIIKLTEKLTNK